MTPPRPSTASYNPAVDRTQESGETPPLTSPMPPGEPPPMLGPYRVVKELGHGGMGTVYVAEDTTLHRRVALKVMNPALAAKPDARQRFLREARAMAAVKHDHIVTVHAVGETDGTAYLAMELLEGTPLNKWLGKNPKPGLRHSVHIAKEIARGLAAAHAKGLVHRDIKPGNIWLEAPKGRVKLLDFGLARTADDDTQVTAPGIALGTPAYMAPEQAKAQPVDGRADLWSLGVLLYRMLAGRLPFDAPNSIAVLAKAALDEPQPLAELAPEAPSALVELVSRLMRKEPKDRPASAAAVAE